MEFGLTQEISFEIKGRYIIDLADELRLFFIDKNYGNDIGHFYIGLICVDSQFEIFFKIRKPRYKSVDKVELFGGIVKELRGVYSYDIKLNYEKFVNYSGEERKRCIAFEIMQSLSNLDKLSKKVKDFDKLRFKSDLEVFFRDHNLLDPAVPNNR